MRMSGSSSTTSTGTNAILLESAQMPHHTDHGRVFAAFGGLQRRYDWLLTGDEQFFAAGDGCGRPTWVGGEELTRTADAGECVYGWAVLSGFEPQVAAGLTGADPAAGLAAAGGHWPYADGNPAFWRPRARPQHPLAAVEVVCFDASLTLVLSRESGAKFTRRFRAYFADALDLDAYVDEHVRPVVETWAAAARALPAGAVLTAPVVWVSQTTAWVELAAGVEAAVGVKQMRAAGFGPRHWFALSGHLKVGQRLTVRVTSIDAERRQADVEFLGLAP
jgi:hypothetical protein